MAHVLTVADVWRDVSLGLVGERAALLQLRAPNE